MKIERNKTFYIQKRALDFFKFTVRMIPDEIYNAIVFGLDMDIDDVRNQDFIKVVDPDAIHFFSNIEWILDFDYYKNLSIDEIVKIKEDYIKKREEYAKEINTTNEQNNEHYRDAFYRYQVLAFIILSFRDLILFKYGDLSISFPNEIGIKRLINQAYYNFTR